MAFDGKKLEKGIGLAVSGGGFRATLFHLGSLWRMNELGLLPKIKRISSVSGGSIVAGLLGVKWAELSFDKETGRARNFRPVIVDTIRAFCERNVDVKAISLGTLNPFKSAPEYVQEMYKEHLYGDATLQDLPDEPRFAINATNLQTGRLFRFSKPYTADWMLGQIIKPNTPISLCVAASSAFPPVLSPVTYEPEKPFSDTVRISLKVITCFGDRDRSFRTIVITVGMGCDHRSEATLDFWSYFRLFFCASSFLFDGPFRLILCELWMTRSQIASAVVGSLM